MAVFKKLKIDLHDDPAIPPPDTYTKEMKSVCQKDITLPCLLQHYSQQSCSHEALSSNPNTTKNK
jgi:hypothetical protein